MDHRRHFADDSGRAVSVKSGLIALPLYGGGASLAGVMDVYRMAYEQACEATRPSLWDLARSVCLN